MDPITQTEGLTPLQALVLLAIQNKQVCNIRALCDTTRITQSNASTLCKKLEQTGFLCRVRSKTDERVVTLSVTPAGREALERVQGPVAFYRRRSGAGRAGKAGCHPGRRRSHH